MRFKTYKIQDFCTMVRGSFPIKRTTPGQYPLVVTGQDRLTANSFQIDGSAICIPIVSSTGHGNASIKRLHYQEGKFALASILVALIPDERVCNAKYLYYLLSAKKDEYILPLMRGSANVSLDPGQLLDLNVSLPLFISEQKRVASILDRTNRMSPKIQTFIKYTSQLMDEVFLKIFGEPDVNPMSWDICPLREIAEIRGGIPMSRERRALVQPRPYLTVRNVYGGYLDLSDVRHMDVKDEELSRWVLKVGDLLVLEGGDRDDVGRTAIYNGELQNCVYQNHVFRVRLKTSKLLPHFLMHFMNNSMMKAKFFHFAKATTGINSINITQLKSLNIPFPPLDLQYDFIRITNKIQEIRQRLILMNTSRLSESLEKDFFR